MTTTDGRHGSRADELLSGWTEVAGRARRPAEAPTGPVVGGLGGLVRFAAPAAMAMVVVLAVGLLPVGRQEYSRMGVGASPGASPGLLDACPVTIPNGVRGGAWPETPLDHGADGIFTALAPDGTIEVPPDGSGVLWRDTLFSLADPAVGPLSVAMNPIGPGASPEPGGYRFVEYPDGNDGDGVLRVDLGFPGEGCWEIVANAGTSQLRFVTRVVRSVDRGLAECQVTRPNEAHTRAWPASELDHGEGGLFTVLWPDGTVLVPVSEVDRDGIGWMKFVFQREGAADGGLRLVGRRIGAEADDPRGAIQSQIPDGYGTTGVQATAIGFPAEGCWEIIAASGTSQLRFRTWVEIAPPTVADLVGETAPTVELAALDGGRGALPVAPDRPTVVTFWGSWCPACTREPDMLAELAATGGVDVVLVAVKDGRSEVSEAVGRPGPPVLLDPEESAFAAYGGFGLPLTVFIDRAGVIRSFVAGPLDAASIAAGLEAIAPIAEFNSEPSGSPIPVRAEPAASPAG